MANIRIRLLAIFKYIQGLEQNRGFLSPGGRVQLYLEVQSYQANIKVLRVYFRELSYNRICSLRL